MYRSILSLKVTSFYIVTLLLLTLLLASERLPGKGRDKTFASARAACRVDAVKSHAVKTGRILTYLEEGCHFS